MLRDVFAGVRRWWSHVGIRGRRELLLVALLLFCYGFFQQLPAWNEYSRYDLVRALVDQGTTRIDTYHDNTGDKAFFQGHWYSDKAPGTALVGVPVYAVARLTGSLAGQATLPDVTAVQVLAFVESGIATAVLVLLLVRLLVPLVGEGWATVVGIGYGLGSIAFPFATMFFGHASSTAALFASFYVLHRWRTERSRWAPVLAGLLAGLAVLIEIPTIIGVAVLGLYALWIDRRGAVAFILGGLPLAMVFAIYNWVSFGSPANLGYMNLLPGSFASGMSEGILGVGWPKAETAGDLLFGTRGLVRLAPWFIAVPAGLVALRNREVRAEVVVCASIVVLFLLYNAGYYLPFGGWTPGPRFLLPALPFAAVLVGFVPGRLRPFAATLVAASIALMFAATVTMPNAPERFDDPLFQLWLPRLLSGELAETGAWIRWGLDGLPALAVLVMATAFAGLGLALSFARPAVASQTATRALAVMGVLVLAFSFPFPPLAPVALGWAGGSSAPHVLVGDIGHTGITIDGDEEFELWARFENRGGAVGSSRLQFTVWTSSGEGVWAAYHGDVAIPTSARDTVTMTWRPGDVRPGTYRYGFTVVDAGSGREYAAVMAGDPIVVGG
jgi:hypothetical protein